MTSIKRWYIQKTITKISQDKALELVEASDDAFITSQQGRIGFIPNKIEAAGEILHCVVKYPLEVLRKEWEIDKFSKQVYLNQIKGSWYNVFSEFILSDFVENERGKIEKVGRYLDGDTSLTLPALERELETSEGLVLYSLIADTSTMIATGKYYVDTGKSASGALVTFQGLMIIPKNIVNAPVPQVAGVRPLSLTEIREIACSPKPEKERKVKPDDPGADAGIQKKKLTAADKTRKQLSKKQKIDISRAVKAKLNQVGDAAFLNALANADQIKTTRDVFDFVLNVLPLGQMIEIALDCAKKFIQITPDNVVCNVIMRNLSNEDVSKLLSYANINLTTDMVAAQFKAQLIDKYDGLIEEDVGGFKNFLRSEFDKNIGTKEIICAMVFAAIPAAITLLSFYVKRDLSNLTPDGTCGDPLFPNEKEIKKLLENPAKQALEQIEKGIKSHPVLSFTKNFTDNMIKQVILFVDQLIVQSISLMLQELAFLCDGSNKSDYANSKTTDPFNSNINDLNTNPNVYDNLFDSLNSDIDKDLIKDFFSDIAELLTLSEICVLFAGDPNDINYSIVIDKIFYGLLELDAYKPLKKLLNTKDKLIDFLNVFADSFDEKLCNERIEGLIKSKKIISELCDPPSDEALIQQLKEKAVQSAIDDLLNQEEDLLNDLLDAIKNIISPENPEVFCGPEADRQGKTPLVPSFQEPSQLHLAKRFLKTTFKAAEKLFEGEIKSFKSILTKPTQFASDPNDLVGSISKSFTAAGQVGKVMSQLYSIENEEAKNKLNSTPGYGDAATLKTALQSYANDNKLVAKKVNDFLIGIQSDLQTDVIIAAGGPIFKYAISGGTDFSSLIYILNYSSDNFIIEDLSGEDAVVQSGFSKLIYDGGEASYSSELPALPEDTDNPYVYNNLDLLNSQSAFTGLLKSMVVDNSFFANSLEQIIREHAEYITSVDLFKKDKFSNLTLVKDNNCDFSLFYYGDILKKLEDRARKVECLTGFGSIPTPSEKALLASVYEGIVRVVITNEMMKSFFVFASFGLEALLPTEEQLQLGGIGDKLSSFYFDYLTQEIDDRINSLNLLTPALRRAITEVYAAENNKKLNETNFEEANLQFIQSSARVVQQILVQKLNKSGVPTKLLETDASYGIFAQEFIGALSPQDKYTQILENIISTNPASNSGGCYSPPAIIDTNYNDKYVLIESTYSKNPRLYNGGFFVEKGIEVFHNRPGNTAPGGFDINSFMKYINALPTTNSAVNFANSAETAIQIDYYNRGFDFEAIKEIVGEVNTEILKNSLNNSFPLQFRNIIEILLGETGDSFDAAVQDYIFGASRQVGDSPKKKAAIYVSATSQDSVEDINFYSSKQGRIAADPQSIDYDTYKNLAIFLTQFADKFYDGLEVSRTQQGENVIVDNLGSFFPSAQTAAEINLLAREELKKIGKYFSTFRTYKTLNLLLRVESTEFVQSNYDFIKGAINLADGVFSDDLKDFIRSGLQRKYFVKEENGPLYFKLPLISVNTDITDINSIEESFNELEEYDLFSDQKLTFDFAEKADFKNLVTFTQYENILSFVSVLVTELVDSSYPSLNSVFNKTLLVLQNSLQNMKNIANRVDNPNVYESNPNIAEFNSPNQADMDLIGLFLEGLLKAVANMTDPTWRTPWFLPGPLTPFGIIAKILDGSDDVSDVNAATQQNELTQQDLERAYNEGNCAELTPDISNIVSEVINSDQPLETITDAIETGTQLQEEQESTPIASPDSNINQTTQSQDVQQDTSTLVSDALAPTFNIPGN